MKYIYIILSLILLPLTISGQQRVYTLSQPDNTGGVYEARDTIRLLKGYGFSATASKTMNARIRPDMLLPAEYQPSGLLPDPNRTLNTSYSVGTTEGTADVSPMGAATYSIPIAVAPGTAGVQPSVNINYNSQSGSGLLGCGWNLSANSVISRTGKTFYLDGKTQEISMTTTDNLVLDGQRLILISGNNLQNGAKYRTEAESFKDVTIKTLNGNIYFEVKDKAGTIYEYGSTDDSNIRRYPITPTVGQNIPIMWLLSKVTDKDGNYMTYTYDVTELGECFLEKIDYTGNKNTAKASYAKVEFFYETRQDTAVAFSFVGNKFQNNLLLRKIKVSYQREVLREYNLKYAYDRSFTKLTEIEEYNGAGERYNSTVINWGGPEDNFGNTFPIGADAIDVGPETKDNFFADFNGDGVPDLFVTQRRDNVSMDWSSGDKASLYLGKRKDNTSGDGKPIVSYDFCTSVDLNGARDLLYGDFNGDGFLDIIRITKGANGYYYWFSLFDGTRFSAFSDTKMVLDNGEYDPFAGDFDGNGKDELALPSGIFDYNGLKEGNVTGLEFNAGAKLHHFQSYKMSRSDFSGNRRAHAVYSKTDGTHIVEYNDGIWRDKFLVRDLIASKHTKLYFGDFNGDGLTDIFALQKENNDEDGDLIYTPYYSKGLVMIRVL
ncbi:MAG: SpvB/TcaC N-terminal domain-containing protein [Bacteroidales bacterium]|nr:SpvB/TcaC N-terminal domain-containing protein [Bacteroidales bacterium]